MPLDAGEGIGIMKHALYENKEIALLIRDIQTSPTINEAKFNIWEMEAHLQAARSSK